MAKSKKKPAGWMVLAQGCGVSLCVELCGVLLLALLVVRGRVPESGVFPMAAVLCLGSALVGGLWAAPRTPWGTLPSALLTAACFGGCLLLAGLLGWDGISWAGGGGVLLGCVFAGGILAGLLGGGRRGRRRHA